MPDELQAFSIKCQWTGMNRLSFLSHCTVLHLMDILLNFILGIFLWLLRWMLL